MKETAILAVDADDHTHHSIGVQTVDDDAASRDWDFVVVVLLHVPVIDVPFRLILIAPAFAVAVTAVLVVAVTEEVGAVVRGTEVTGMMAAFLEVACVGTAAPSDAEATAAYVIGVAPAEGAFDVATLVLVKYVVVPLPQAVSAAEEVSPFALSWSAERLLASQPLFLQLCGPRRGLQVSDDAARWATAEEPQIQLVVSKTPRALPLPD